MNQEETIARFRQGKDAWNAWAEATLATREAMEADGRWAAEEDSRGDLEARNEETADWLEHATADFTALRLITRALADAEPVKGGSKKEDEVSSAEVKSVVAEADTIDLEGWIFPGPAGFAEVQFHGQAEFAAARFHGGAWFGGARFHGRAGFGGAQFHGRAEFGGAQFHSRAGFGGAQFHDEAQFGGARFHGRTEFGGAQFHGEAEFGGTQFHGRAGFVEAQFHNRTGFRRAQFHDEAQFAGAQFHGGAGFAEAQFCGDADFRLVVFCYLARFSDARFAGAATFNAVRGERSFDLANAVFDTVPDFIQAHFEEAPRLDNVRVEPRMLPAHPALVLRKDADGNDIAPRWRERNGHRLKRCASLPRRFLHGAGARVTKTDRHDITARWRALKRLAIQAHDQDREHEFFAQEIRSARFVTDWPWPKPFFEARGWIAWARFVFGYAYGLTSNYGRSVLLPLMWWSLGVAIAAMYYLGEQPQGELPSMAWKRLVAEHQRTTLPYIPIVEYGVTSMEAWNSARPCYVPHPLPEKIESGQVGVIALSQQVRDQTSASREALQLALRDGFLILYGDADTAHRTYGCLYGIELYGGGTPVAIVPPQVGFWSAMHKLYSAVMIFLFGLALRNMLKMK